MIRPRPAGVFGLEVTRVSHSINRPPEYEGRGNSSGLLGRLMLNDYVEFGDGVVVVITNITTYPSGDIHWRGVGSIGVDPSPPERVTYAELVSALRVMDRIQEQTA